MNTQELSLCGKCAALMKTAFKVNAVAGGGREGPLGGTVKKTGGGRAHKVKCDNCGRTRYGGIYELSKASDAGEK